MLLDTPQLGTYRSLTDMAIEQEKNKAQTEIYKGQVQELQNKAQQQERIKQRIMETYKSQQQPSQEQLANLAEKTEDQVVMQDSQFQIQRLQQQADILMQEGDTTGYNVIADNIKDAKKSLIDYTDNKKKAALAEDEQIAQVMGSATDTASYRAALNEVADMNPNKARSIL